MRHVLCVGMYRACSTWQYEVLSHLVEIKLGGERLGFLDGDSFAASRCGPSGPGRVGVLKFHDAHPAFSNALASGEARAAYAIRDLRDVAYSYMHKASLSFGQIIADRFIPKVLKNDRFWRSQRGVITQRYETILEHPIPSVMQLSTHAGIAITGDEATKLAAEYSWQSNLVRTLAVRRDAEADGLDLNDRANTYRHDPVTLLHWNHMRLRRSTTWRHLSSAAERETLAHLCGDWLIENGYEPDASWVSEPWGPEGIDKDEGLPTASESRSGDNDRARAPGRPMSPNVTASRRPRDWLRAIGPGALVSGRVGC